jgi:hypothetical protein
MPGTPEARIEKNTTYYPMGWGDTQPSKWVTLRACTVLKQVYE